MCLSVVLEAEAEQQALMQKLQILTLIARQILLMELEQAALLMEVRVGPLGLMQIARLNVLILQFVSKLQAAEAAS